jgi:putative two-component system response regulator
MLAGSASPMLQMAQEIALSHHERWDGGGYPHGISGLAIPEVARIVAIVDVYDALSHDRVYRKALPENEVLQIIERGRGSHFDPDVFDLFLSTFPMFQGIRRQHPDKRETRCGNIEFAPSGVEISPPTWLNATTV